MTASPSPSAHATATPLVRLPVLDPVGSLAGIETVQVRLGAEQPLPEGMSLIVESRCPGCAEPLRLQRLSRPGGGALAAERVFSLEGLGLPPRVVELGGSRIEEAPYVSGFAAAEDGSDIVAGVCTRGVCGPLEAPTPDAETTLFRSRDGGTAWERWGVLESGQHVGGVLVDGRLVAVRWDGSVVRGWGILPGEDEVYPPPGFEPFPPSVVSNEALVWRVGPNQLVDSGGRTVMYLGGTVDLAPPVLRDSSSGRLLVSATDRRRGVSMPLHLVARVEPYAGVLELYELPVSVTLGAVLDAFHLVAAAGLEPGAAPVIVDLSAAAIHPIEGAAVALGPGEHRVIAVIR
jgi:hypothetical protein